MAQFFTPAEADTIAKSLNSSVEDDWSYKVVNDPKGTGYSFIEIYDEDGELIGKL